MYLHRSAAEIVVQAPAKLNLFLEVLAKRDDGYHEIETLMCPIDLYDTLYFRKEPSRQLQLRCERAGRLVGRRSAEGDRPEAQEVPEGRGNLAVQAVELLRRESGVDAGATLRLVKRIPTAAGLGGGSSDAAAALIAANVGYGLGWSWRRLIGAAAELGSDVPFFLTGGLAICRGRGERVEPIEVPAMFHFVVVRPPAGLATAAVYRACRPANAPRAVAPLLEAVIKGDARLIGRLLFNRLQPAAGALSPWINRLQRAFQREDCLGHGISGSGTSYFGLCRHASHARRLAKRLEASGVGSVFVVRSCR